MDSSDWLLSVYLNLQERNDVTDFSDGDEEPPLSHAEESAIEECLNDTEGSLSTVDLDIFDDIGDFVPVNKTRKSRGQRTSERVNMDLTESGTDSSSVDDMMFDRRIDYRRPTAVGRGSDNRKSLISDSAEVNQTVAQTAQLSLQERTGKSHRRRLGSVPTGIWNVNKNRRIVRSKRRNSPPIRKNDKTHIYSFFSAMADLVSTFPDQHVETATKNVCYILHDMVDKLTQWCHNNDPKNPSHGSSFNPSDLRLIQHKLSLLPYNK